MLFNAGNVACGDLRIFVAHTADQSPLVQLVAIKFVATTTGATPTAAESPRSTSTAQTTATVAASTALSTTPTTIVHNMLIVPFPRPNDDQIALVRVGELAQRYPDFFETLDRMFDGDSPTAPVAPTAPPARVLLKAVRICASYKDLLQFNVDGFRLSASLRPLFEVCCCIAWCR